MVSNKIQQVFTSVVSRVTPPPLFVMSIRVIAVYQFFPFVLTEFYEFFQVICVHRTECLIVVV